LHPGLPLSFGNALLCDPQGKRAIRVKNAALHGRKVLTGSCERGAAIRREFIRGPLGACAAVYRGVRHVLKFLP
jgi:hypothetical protein